MSATILESPNETALRLTGRDYISYSSISSYQACPLKWHFRYSLGLAEESVSSALVFGSAIHAAAEHHFRELLAGNPAPGLDMLLGAYQDEWAERDDDNIAYGKTEDRDSLTSLAERMLSAFQESDFARPAGEIVGIEEVLRGELVPGCPDLLAKVDLIVEEEDALVVTDLKTARSRWSQSQVEQSADQLLLYGELAKGMVSDKPVKLQFAVITKTKSPALDINFVPVIKNQVERTKATVEAVWRSIEAGIVYPSPSPMRCPGCGYRNECRSWCG